MFSTVYSQASTCYQDDAQEARWSKRNQFRNQIAKEKRDGIRKHIREMQLYPGQGRAQSASLPNSDPLNVRFGDSSIDIQQPNNANQNSNADVELSSPKSCQENRVENAPNQDINLNYSQKHSSQEMSHSQPMHNIQNNSQQIQPLQLTVPESQLQNFQNQSNPWINPPYLQSPFQNNMAIQFNHFAGNSLFRNKRMQLEDPQLMSPSPHQESFRLSPQNSPEFYTSPPHNGSDFSFNNQNRKSPQSNVSPPQKINFSFSAQHCSPPTTSHYPNYVDYSFGKQPIIQTQPLQPYQPSQMRISPEQKPLQDQGIILHQNILSNGQILKDPNYVNPYLEFIEQKATENSAKHILAETKKKIQEQKNQKIEKQDDFVRNRSPFTKNKIIPEPYSAIQVIQEKETKPYQELSLKNVNQNKKKPQETPHTSEKRQKVEPQEKVNPEKPKEQNPNKKEPKKEDLKEDLINTEKQIAITKEPITKPVKHRQNPVQINRILQPISNQLDILSRKHKILKLHKHYIIFDKLLGKGSFAEVYLGINNATKQKVAVKKLKIKSLKQMSEVQCLKELTHPNVVMLYDYFREQSTKNCYLFLEFCEENLRERLDEIAKQKLNKYEELRLRINYVEQLIEGMNVLNYKGYVHRDLKFQNILVKGDLLKIGDFGLCRKLNHKLQIESIRCGTPYTMAPQIYFHPKDSYSNPTYTQKADIFSLAVLLHQLIYNEHPFDYQERHVKTLSRIDISHNENILKKVCSELQIDITWIKEIIDKGLMNQENRLTWERLMKIYHNRHKNQIKPKPLSEKPVIEQILQYENQNIIEVPEPKNHQVKAKQSKRQQKTKKIEDLQEKFDKILREKQKPAQIKYPEFQPRTSQNKTSRPKQKFDIFEESKKVFGDPSNSNENQQLKFSNEPSRIISFDKFEPLKNKKIEDRGKINKNQKSISRKIQKRPQEIITTQSDQSKASKPASEQKIMQMQQIINMKSVSQVKKKGKTLFNLFAMAIIMWAGIIAVNKIFYGAN